MHEKSFSPRRRGGFAIVGDFFLPFFNRRKYIYKLFVWLLSGRAPESDDKSRPSGARRFSLKIPFRKPYYIKPRSVSYGFRRYFFFFFTLIRFEIPI